ncbi:hypothetical protein WJ969_04765 [Achromobacter xylosoxidans]
MRGLDLLAQFRALLFRVALDGRAGLLAERRDDFRLGLDLPAQLVAIPFFVRPPAPSPASTLRSSMASTWSAVLPVRSHWTFGSVMVTAAPLIPVRVMLFSLPLRTLMPGAPALALLPKFRTDQASPLPATLLAAASSAFLALPPPSFWPSDCLPSPATLKPPDRLTPSPCSGCGSRCH